MHRLARIDSPAGARLRTRLRGPRSLSTLFVAGALLAVSSGARGTSERAAPSAPTPALAPSPSPTVEPPSDVLIHARDPLPGVRTGGVPPSDALFAKLAAEGFVTFVDLRREPELSAAARAGAEAAGLRYVRIEVGSDVDLDLGSARALDALVDDPSQRPLVVACSSGNRSGALLAVHAFWLDGKPAEEALALGRAAGLTRLEPSVRTLLGLPPLPPDTPAN